MTIYETVKKGLPLKDVLIIDEHAHNGIYPGIFLPDYSDQAIIDEMDAMGIDIACLSHLAAIGPDHTYGNNKVIEAIEKHPGRFVGYCTINPHYPDEIENELKRCFSHKGIKGIKLHPWNHDRTLAYKNYRPVYEFAAKQSCCILVHTYSWTEVSNMAKLAAEYPNVNWLMAHTGGEMPTVERAIDVINKYDNIYTDLAVSESKEGNVEWLVREIGSKKLLFGTDLNCMNPRATLARVAMAEISEDEKKDILGLNMKKILKI